MYTIDAVHSLTDTRMDIPVFTSSAATEEMLSALDQAGCMVVTGLLSEQARTSISAELAPHMANASVIEDDDPEAFYPGKTRRTTALLTRSNTIAEQLVPHAMATDVCDRFLLPNGEFGYQLHVTAALEVGPGAREQELHREEDSFQFFPLPRPNLIVASMWAISDFRAENGATLIVPGSHQWPAERVPEAHEIIAAEMPAGSVLFWLGGLLHGAGANTSQDWRYGVILTYSLGWLRQEENQYLDVPAQQIAKLSPKVKKIAGFEMYRALGLYDPSIGA